jgi:hypothetical protein
MDGQGATRRLRSARISSGSFEISLEPGRYRVSLEIGAKPQRVEPEEVTIAAGGRQELTLFRIQGSARLRGRLVDCAGNPVPEIRVTAEAHAGSCESVSDESGCFEFAGIEPGEELELFIDPKTLPPTLLAPWWQRLVPYQRLIQSPKFVASVEAEVVHELTLDEIRPLTLRLLGVDGRAFAAATVSLRAWSPDERAFIGGNWVLQADEYGRVLVDDLTPGSYRAYLYPIAAPGMPYPRPVEFVVACNPGSAKQDLVFQAREGRGIIELFAVNEAGQPAPRWTFGLYPIAESLLDHPVEAFYPLSVATTDLSGRLSFQNLSEGRYRLRPSDLSTPAGSFRLHRGEPVDLEIGPAQMALACEWRTALRPEATLTWKAPSRPEDRGRLVVMSARFYSDAGPFGASEHELIQRAGGSFGSDSLPAGVGRLEVAWGESDTSLLRGSVATTEEFLLELLPGPNSFRGDRRVP